jgi:hypothetical protein
MHVPYASAAGPACPVEGAGMEVTPARPAPDRGDVVTHGGLVQLEAELAVGGGGRPQCARAKLGQRSPGVIMGGFPAGQRTATATHYMLVF